MDLFKEMIQNSNNIVFFGGAGVSTESGIPDFRSENGIYKSQYRYAPETILSHTFFVKNTEDFYDFYKTKMIFPHAKPNKAHTALSKLEDMGKLKAVITQNVDGLHQMAGSKNVLELHGSVYRNYCEKCKQFYDLDYVIKADGVPFCKCGGVIKPDVVLYEEGLNNETINRAIHYIENAEVVIVGGTSLSVYPAAGLLDYYNGDKLILINKSSTPMDHRAKLIIQESIGEAFENAMLQEYCIYKKI